MTLPVPVPANGVAGVDVSAAFWNAQVRDTATYLLNPPHCVMYQTVQQTGITSVTPILFDTNEVDSYNGHSTVTNTSQYVAQVPGWYAVSGQVAYNAAGTAGSTRVAAIAKNGTIVPGGDVILRATDINFATVVPTPTREVFLNTGDFVQLMASASASANTNVSGGAAVSMMTIRWVHG